MAAMEAGGVTAMHDATEGGVIGALFEIANASSVGNVINVPPPANALISPAATAENPTSIKSTPLSIYPVQCDKTQMVKRFPILLQISEKRDGPSLLIY